MVHVRMGLRIAFCEGILCQRWRWMLSGRGWIKRIVQLVLPRRESFLEDGNQDYVQRGSC